MDLGRHNLQSLSTDDPHSHPVELRCKSWEEKHLPKLLKPVDEHRPATLLFDYPPQCGLPSRCNARVVELSADAVSLTFKVCESTRTYNCFLNAFLYNGFVSSPDDSFTFLISGLPKPGLIASLLPFQRLNHFPNSLQLGRKDCLWRNIDRMQRKFGREYEIIPTTFIFPKDFEAFESARISNPQIYWIRKPVASSCGRGVRVLRGTERVRKQR